jgi:hypothetical protein
MQANSRMLGTVLKHCTATALVAVAVASCSNRAEPLLCVRVALCAGADVSLELPTIVVCGQQSAGKSSVVEVRTGLALSTAGSRHQEHSMLWQTQAGCAVACHHQPPR